MSELKLEIVTPEGVVFSESVAGVEVPTVNGQIGVLPGHIPLLTLMVPGELQVLRSATSKEFLAVDRGFVRVLGNTLSVLTEAAIHIDDIDLSLVHEAQQRAQIALKEAENHPHMDPAEIEKLESIVRFSVLQKLVKEKHY